MREARPSWLAVFRKEFLEIFRDKRTAFNIIISPLLITPLILVLVGSVGRREAKKSQTEQVAVAIIGSQKAPALMEALKGAENLTWTPTTREEAEQGIRTRKFKAGAVIPNDAEQRMAETKTVRVTVLVDEGNGASSQAGKRLESLFTERGQRVTAQRLMEQGLSSELATPFQTVQKPVTGGGSSTTLFLAVILPYILAFSAIMGGIYAASDSVAGEKERGTLETLLVSPAPRTSLVMGKFLAVAAISLVNSVLSVVGMLWPFYVPLEAFQWLSQGGLSLTPLAVVMILLVQIPLAVLGAGVLMAVSTFARNQKEAGSYLGPVILLTSVAAMMSMLLKTDSAIWYSLVPVLNVAMVLKQSLEGQVNILFVAIASVASVIYAGLALLFAIRLFHKEEVLLKA